MSMTKHNNRNFLSLFLTLLKIGAFTFGGGYAMIALLENELIEKKGWIAKDEFVDMVAIAESTPGPIAINVATYVGYKVAGVWGSIISTIAVCIPSFLIIYLISLFFKAFLSMEYVAYAFQGIQVAVTFLILFAGLKMLKKMKKSVFNIIVLFLTMTAVISFSLFSVEFSTIYYILLSGILGLTVYTIKYLIDKKQSNMEGK